MRRTALAHLHSREKVYLPVRCVDGASARRAGACPRQCGRHTRTDSAATYEPMTANAAVLCAASVSTLGNTANHSPIQAGIASATGVVPIQRVHPGFLAVGADLRVRPAW